MKGRSSKNKLLRGSFQDFGVVHADTVGIELDEDVVGFFSGQLMLHDPIDKLQVLHAAFEGAENQIEESSVFTIPALPDAETIVGKLDIAVVAEEMLDTAEALEGLPVTLAPVTNDDQTQIF